MRARVCKLLPVCIDDNIWSKFDLLSFLYLKTSQSCIVFICKYGLKKDILVRVTTHPGCIRRHNESMHPRLYYTNLVTSVSFNTILVLSL